MNPKPETVILKPENTGGIEMTFLRKVIGIPHPHVPDSYEKPLRADIETLIWNKPDSDTKPGKKVQYVVMGGININAVEVHPILAMLTNHADTIVGVAHPDAPQSKIIPNNSPFNELKSFANSGYTTLRTIEKLYEDGVLDPNSLLTVVGFSTGGAVLTETIAQDIVEATAKNRTRYIQQAVLLSPGGMLEIGDKEIEAGVGATGLPYFQEFVDTQWNALKMLLKNPKKLADALADSMNPGSIFEEIAHAINIRKRWRNNLDKMKTWSQDKEWQEIRKNHKVFEMIENLLRTPRIQFINELLAHFHRMWIDQPGWPHWSPNTAAFLRSKINVGHDVTQQARRTIRETPLIVLFGHNDQAIQPTKFLTVKDKQVINGASGTKDHAEVQNLRILRRIREAYPNNQNNVHILLTQGVRSHHLGPRSNASLLEMYLLRYLYPEKMPEVKTIYVGSSR